MKFFILDKVLRFVGGKLDGYKTIIGGIGIILTGLPPIISGVLGILGHMFPDQNLPHIPLDASYAHLKMGAGIISGGMVALGLGGKAEKLKKAVEAGNQVKVSAGASDVAKAS